MRLIRVLEFALIGVIAVAAVLWGVGEVRNRSETERATARFDPPVWAGQNVPNACSGGFYARKGDTIVITIVAHCAIPGTTLREDGGRLVGVFGPLMQVTDCPVGRLCAPSDFLALALAPGRIPWGHLNQVDLGAGGYRTIAPGTRPLACGDIAVGARAEVDGREHYRAGAVLGSEVYDFEPDILFPCMVVADIAVVVGDSGSAVLVDGLPAGVTSRRIGDRLGFTPLAEGLENLGLTLCTTPDCDLSPDRAVQPTS